MLTIPPLCSGGIIANYHCSSACRHCLYNCSPQRPREYMNTDTCNRIAHIIKGLGVQSVHIGGGEPLLVPEKLYPLLTVLRGSGMDVEYVETNASWYTTPDRAAVV